MSSEDSRVLIVSPVADIRATYSTHLRRHGMVVDVAEDVIQGFVKAVEEPPSVVVVDDATPGSGGFLSRIRGMTRTCDTYRLLLASSVPVARGVEQATAVLLKPAWPDDFYGKVLRLVLDRADAATRRPEP